MTICERHIHVKNESCRKCKIEWAEQTALGHELAALHNLQSAAQIALRDVPHQRDCARLGHEAAECTCIRSQIAILEYTLHGQLG